MDTYYKHWPMAEVELEDIRLVLQNAGKQPMTPQQLIDFEQIKATQNKYCFCVDHGVDLADFEDVFCEDLTSMTFGNIADNSPQKRKEATRGITKIAGGVSHQTHNPIVYFVDADTAILLCSLNDRISFKDGKKFEGWGWYCNTFVRCPDGQWRIKKLIDSWMSTEGYIPGCEAMFGIEPDGNDGAV